jgi:hypothetical protein
VAFQKQLKGTFHIKREATPPEKTKHEEEEEEKTHTHSIVCKSCKIREETERKIYKKGEKEY